MESSRFDSLTLIAAVIGAGVLGSQSLAIGSGAASAGDVAILLAIFGFDNAGIRSMAQSLAFGGVTGFCVLTPFLWISGNILGFTLPPATTFSWTVMLIWLVAGLILFSVDRFRMSARESVGLAATGLGAAPAVPITFTPSPQAAYRPAPLRVEPVAAPPVPVPPPAPTYYQPPPPPAAPAPIYHQPPPAPPPVPPAAPVHQPVPEAPTFSAPPPVAPSIPYTAPPPVPPTPDVTAIPPGREAIIYLNLVGEGLNVLRTVRAENLGRDYYRIADVMPENEQWEFTPGQVVRCRKKTLSNGKHMVAYEEAPRAQ